MESDRRGMPGAFEKKEIMQHIAPLGNVYQAAH